MIALNMIVKNESAQIAEAIASAAPYVDAVCIIDTGSTDDTIRRIEIACADHGLLAQVEPFPWVDFATARNQALAFAETRGAEWALILDADARFTPGPEWRGWPGETQLLTADVWNGTYRYGGLVYARPMLVRLHSEWRWRGAVHEGLYFEDDREPLIGVVPGLVITEDAAGHRGARSQDPLKFAKDAEMLEAEIEGGQGNDRSVFYLGQSYRDAGMLLQAAEAYQTRVIMGGWAEEVFWSLLQLAVIDERLGNDPRQGYLTAWEYRPTRAEPLVELARYCRLNGMHQQAYLYAKAAMGVTPGPDTLFIDEAAYGWRRLDEYALACHETGRQADAVLAGRSMLELECLPETERPRIETNLEFFRAGLS